MGPRRYTIKQLPPELRPRERLLSDGPEALSSAELLAILLSTGSKESTAVELAGQVISESGDLFGLHGVSIQVRKHKTVWATFQRRAGEGYFRGTLRAHNSELASQRTIGPLEVEETPLVDPSLRKVRDSRLLFVKRRCAKARASLPRGS